MSDTVTTKETPKRSIKETLFTRHLNTVELMMLADNMKATLKAIHTDAVNKAVNDQKNNLVLDDLPHPINDSEKGEQQQLRKRSNQEGTRYSRPVKIRIL